MKIIFNDVSIRNFLSFGNISQKFIFKEGINVITGTNGVGKSSLSDSLSFCLFGKVLRDINQDDLINWRNRKECVVSSNFIKGNIEYKVIRGLRPHFLEIYENGSLLPKVGKRDSQSQLEEILGFSYNTYSNLVYTNINFNVPIMKMSRGQKREFIERLFNIEVFTQLSEKCKNKLKNIEKRKAIIKARETAIAELLKEYDNIISNYENELLESSTAKGVLEQLKDEKLKLDRDCNIDIKNKLEKDIESIKKKSSIENDKLSNLKFSISNLENDIKKYENKIDLLKEENKCPTCDSKIDPNKLKEKFLKKIKNKNASIEIKENDKNPLIDKINEIELDLEEKNEKLKDYYSKNSRLVILANEIEHFTESLDKAEITKQNIQIKINEYIDKKNKLLNEKEGLQSELSRIESIQDYLIYTRDQCRDENVKQYAISSIIPYINKFTNEYLAQVGFNFFIEIDKFIDAKIKGPGIFGESISNLSGGESKSIDLSLMLAFHDVGLFKAKNFADVFFLDEILDSSVDTINISKIYDIIKMKQAKDALKVYIISHRPEVLDMEFNGVIKVKKENGFTKIHA
jgi:DNA repair exonuclease SbcCD ATPase subunit